MAKAISVCVLLLLGGVALGRPATQPDALPTVQAAAQAAKEWSAGSNVVLGSPRLYAQDEGLAVDRSDPAHPQVVAYVGPSWIVPATADPAKPTPLGLVLDRGTGRLVAQAHDVLPMPRQRVYYVDQWQLPATALLASDAVSSGVGGAGLSLQLDVGGGARATMTINAGATRPRPTSGTRIAFAGRQGVLTTRTTGNFMILQAFSDDGELMANANFSKADAKLEKRFKDVLAGLAPRPDGTRIWPSDSRPRLASIPDWVPSGYGNSDLGLWHPQSQAKPAGATVLHAYAAMNSQVYSAAKVMHPYDLPPTQLTDGLDNAADLARRPIELAGWVGIEREVELRGPAVTHPAHFAVRQPQQARDVKYRARVLDLRRDVRRLMIRCQAPAESYATYAEQFDKLLKAIRLPDELLEPIVVPLEPITYKGR